MRTLLESIGFGVVLFVLLILGASLMADGRNSRRSHRPRRMPGRRVERD